MPADHIRAPLREYRTEDVGGGGTLVTRCAWAGAALLHRPLRRCRAPAPWAIAAGQRSRMWQAAPARQDRGQAGGDEIQQLDYSRILGGRTAERCGLPAARYRDRIRRECRM